ncbi:hypothetical protein SSS_07174 [Sarcoptes scabiei]|uniref:Uncharacterized protein n=1 Tax=Sarcoptes scabiei TaxID=52283 RepID=A0A834RGB0_SARSC|nr:hypothetical protein SSS_07174 [Sarcoptes scabiei]
MITSREEFLTKNQNYSNDSRLINQRDDFLTLNQNDFIHNLPLNDNDDDDDDDEDEEEEEDEVDEDKDDVNHSDQFDCWRFHSEDIKSLADHNQLKLSSKFDSDQIIFDRFGNSRSNFKEKTTKRIVENFSKSLPLKSRPNEKIKSRPPRLKNRIETQLNKTSKFDEKTSTISRKQSVSNRTNIFHYDSKGFKEIKSNFGDEDHSSNIRAETYLNFDSNRFDLISGEEFGQNLTTIRSGGQSSTNLSAFSESSLSNQTNHLKAKSKSSKSKTNRSLKSKGSIIRTPLNATKSNSLGLGHNATDCNGISNSLLSLLPNNEDNLEKILSESYQSTSRISTSCASQQNSKTSSVISSLISNKINKNYINENLNNSIAHNSTNSVPFPLTTPLSIKHSDRSMIPKQSIQISNLDSDFVNVSLSTNQSESINFSTTNVDRPSITFPSDSFATQNLQLQTMATLAARQFLSSGSTLSYPYLNLNDPLSSKLSSIQDDNTLCNKFFRSSDTVTTSNSNMASSIDSDTTANQNLSKNWWKRNGNL